MAIIYNYLKNVWNNLLKESKINISFWPLILLMVTIPLKLGINNFFLALFIVSIIINDRKSKFTFSLHLMLPILLFLWMALSYLWSIDTSRTLNAIPKEIALLIIPICFSVFLISKKQKQDAIRVYSIVLVLIVVYYLIRAIIRFAIIHDSRVFFYHGENEDDYGLVPKLLNAIHVSVFVSIAFFYFFTQEIKTKLNVILSLLLFTFIILLSSKNIILVVIILITAYLLFYSKIANKMRLRNLIVLALILGLAMSFGKIKERFEAEFQQHTSKSISHNVIKKSIQNVHNVSIFEAWNNKNFYPNAFFPGTAFRVYQARLFFEFLDEEPIFWKGFGLNASVKKIEEKGKYYNVFLGNDNTEGYQKKNFHNQYIQNFAELGFVGFVLLIVILALNLKNAFKTKDFVHIAFAILMISLFLTESFLWRQRGMVFFALFYCFFNHKNDLLQLKSKS